MRKLQHLLIRGILPLLLLTGCLVQPVSADQDPRALDPSDVFFQAWLTIREAEKLQAGGKHSDAWRKYRQAANYYDTLVRFHPEWKPHLVQGRVETTRTAIKAIEPLAAAEIAGKNKRTEDLVESGNPASNPRPATNHRITPKPPTNPVAYRPDPKLQRKLRQLELDNRRLGEQLKKLRAASSSTTTNNKEQQRLIKIIAQKDREIATMRDTLARAPLQQDMDRLAREKRTREHELKITAQTLVRTKQKLKQEQELKAKHEEDLKLAQIRHQQLVEQKNIDNRIVRKLREELKNVTAVLGKTRQELGAANQRIATMQLRLQQAETTIKELKVERDALRLERDTLADILKKSDSKGVQRLITENMRLGRELKEALDRLTYLEKSNNTTKEELLEAKSDLAIAKTQILRYQQEKTSQQRIIRSLEKRLQDARTELAQAVQNPTNPANQEEIDTLRATVKRLIAAQERRKMGEKILWDAYQNAKTVIPGMSKAYADLMKTNVELNEEEKKMLATRRPDSEFTSPERVTPEHARFHGAELQKQVATYEPLIKRFFQKGRYEAARETLLELDERFPGHFPTLCNRGVVEIKTGRYTEAEEIFNEAITMRENSGYAHYMLGKTHYLLKNFESSRKSFEHSLTLQSDNPDAYLYLGNIAGAGRRYQQAEKLFQQVIKLNPTSAEAYFNLSIIYLRQNKKQQALEAYNKALNHGAQPDPNHENKLSAAN